MNLGGWEVLGWALLATGILILLLAVWVAVRRKARLRRPHQLGDREDPAEVTAPAAGLLDGDESSSLNGASDPWSESVIYGLAKQLATAVDKLDENKRAEARREAEMAAATIRATAQVEARRHVLEPARAQAKTESNTTIAEAEREGLRIRANAVKKARGTIDAAQNTADRLLLSDTGKRMRGLTEGLKSAADNIDSLKRSVPFR
jgi:hypothetical protein